MTKEQEIKDRLAQELSHAFNEGRNNFRYTVSIHVDVLYQAIKALYELDNLACDVPCPYCLPQYGHSNKYPIENMMKHIANNHPQSIADAGYKSPDECARCVEMMRATANVHPKTIDDAAIIDEIKPILCEKWHGTPYCDTHVCGKCPNVDDVAKAILAAIKGV